VLIAASQPPSFSPGPTQMDEELLLLQQQFQAAQEVKAATRLSERNVVELVSKLTAMGLLGDDLLYSLNGKEYITQERLQQELEEEVRRRGRVSLVDLGTLLNVDLFYCERAAKNILENAKLQEQPWVQLVQGELITHDYWDGVADEVDAALQESGQVAVSDLAMRFNVGAELMGSILSSRLGSRIHGTMSGGQLFTGAHMARMRAAVRGELWEQHLGLLSRLRFNNPTLSPSCLLQIHGTMSGGQLFTGAHMARMRAAVRGAARALTEAANMADIWPSVVRELGRDYGREYGDGTEVKQTGEDAAAGNAAAAADSAAGNAAAAADSAAGSGGGFSNGSVAATDAAASIGGPMEEAATEASQDVASKAAEAKGQAAGGAEAGRAAGGGGGGKAEAVGAAEAAMFARVFGECVAEGEVRGSSKGGGTGWVPEIFAQLQRQSVEAFFSQNAFITFSAVRQLGIPQPRQYLESLFLDKSSALLLQSTFTHSLHQRLYHILCSAAAGHSPAAAVPGNAFITFSAVRQLGIPQPRQYLESLFPDKSSALLLDSTLVHSSLVHQLDAAVEEAITAKSWWALESLCHCFPHLHSPFAFPTCIPHLLSPPAFPICFPHLHSPFAFPTCIPHLLSPPAFPICFPHLHSPFAFPTCFPHLHSPFAFPTCFPHLHSPFAFPTCFPHLHSPFAFPTCFPHLHSPFAFPTCFPHLLYPPALPTCFTHLLYPPAIPTCFTRLLYPPALPACFTHLLYPPAIPTCFTRLLYPPALPACFTHLLTFFAASIPPPSLPPGAMQQQPSPLRSLLPTAPKFRSSAPCCSENYLSHASPLFSNLPPSPLHPSPSRCDAATALPPALSPSDCAQLLQLCPVLLRAQKAAALAAASTAASGAGGAAAAEGQGLDGAEVYGDTCLVSSALLQVSMYDDAAEYDEADDAEGGGSAGLARVLVAALKPALFAYWAEERRRAAAFTSGSTTETRRQVREAVESRVNALLGQLVLYAHGAAAFNSDEDAATAALISRHVLRTSASEPVDLLLHAVLLDHDVITAHDDASSSNNNESGKQSGEQQEGTGAEAVSGGGADGGAGATAREEQGGQKQRENGASGASVLGSTPIVYTPARRAALAKLLPGGGPRERAVRMVAAVEGKEVEAVLLPLEEVAEKDLGIRLKRPDKKAERALLFSMKK
ncbi:unnamed protein product, partial [Closterium sp. Naga37s-1]